MQSDAPDFSPVDASSPDASLPSDSALEPGEPVLASADPTSGAPQIVTDGYVPTSQPILPIQQHYQEYPIQFLGEGKPLLVLLIKNLLLGIVTLGVYTFWGRTNVRRWVWQNIDFAGERLVYHGTGKELLIGGLKAIGFLIVLSLINQGLAFGIGGDAGQLAATAVTFLAILAIMPLALVGGLRYRLSRTSYRGVFLSLRTTPKEFYPVYLKETLLLMITFGLRMPWYLNNLRQYLIPKVHYGNVAFRYDGSASDLVKPYFLFLVLYIPSLYTMLFYWWARSINHQWNHTTVQGARFRSSLQGRQLLWLTVTNLLLVIFTLGIGVAWARVRMLRYMLGNLRAYGEFDFNLVMQQETSGSTLGEGLSHSLDGDMDADFGI
jgi:uncharacterized membrane protein YjgN (DUF898 family)